ncbi:MAG: hypothetical protein A2543_01940 [Candidatus Komeilibacteria bacterium RIFOXYD2_FULL_37_8]|nr:MAG: hypothetical protein A2543_01940 [Candidatus Komeilibacteria bacterium RIFOXYD2_FULL_37_8]
MAKQINYKIIMGVVDKILYNFNNGVDILSCNNDLSLVDCSGKLYEYETKVNLDNFGDLAETLRIIKSLKILKFENRSEMHYLFNISENIIAYLVFVDGLSQVWIKFKYDINKINTSEFKIPLILRRGKKFRPGDYNYKRAFHTLMKGKYYDSYYKKCINYFFRYNNFFYSLSLSLVNNQNGFQHNQMEFEYEGVLKGMDNPNREDILKGFDLLFKNSFPFLFGKFNTETKYEALKNQFR